VVQANLSLVAFFIQPSSISANHCPKPRTKDDDDEEEDWEMT
jgi:hypothetical protein